jgi:WD40 repeat protein
LARIFLSHSSVNNAEAIALRDWLIGEGWDDLFLDLDPTRGIAAGERWERALHEAANRCEAVLFLVSEAWLNSRWCLKEFNLALKLNKRVFGVLIEDFPLAGLPGDLTATWQFVNLAAGSDHVMLRAALPDKGGEAHVTFSRAELRRLKTGLERAGLDARFFAWPPDGEPDRPPYRGMRPLEAEDAGIFFGREAPIIEVLDRLRGLSSAAPPRFLAILGASGAGKSSFLRAGLLPRLKRDDRSYLTLPIVRPERGGLYGETGFLRSLEAAGKALGLKWKRAEIKAAIDRGADAVLSLLAELAEKARAPQLGEEGRQAPPRLVLPIDQGEELFLAEGSKEAGTFLKLLKVLVSAGASNLIVLITIRSDSYERLQTAPELDGVTQQTYSLPPLPRGAYQTVIEGPAERLKDSQRTLRIEPALTAALLADFEAGGAKDALPLLAFTLERLYLEHGGDGNLKRSEYREIGGIKGSIEAAVERALERADSDPAIPKDPAAREALLRRTMIPWLAGIDPETGEPRRRVARLAEVPKESRPLIEHLVAERLLAADTSPVSGERIIEPAHEALLRQWGLLRRWLSEESAALATLEGVKRATRDWAANAYGSDWLNHAGTRLEDAEKAAARNDLAGDLSSDAREYLRKCREQEERRQRERLERLEAEREERELRRKYRNRAIFAGAAIAGVLMLLVFAIFDQSASRIKDSAGNAQYQASIGSFDNAFELANESETRLSWLGSGWLCGLIAKAPKQRWLTFDCGQLHDAVAKAYWSIASRIHELGILERRGGAANTVWGVSFDPTASADTPRLLTTGFLGYVHVLEASPGFPWEFRCTKEFRVSRQQQLEGQNIVAFGVRRAIIVGNEKKIVTMGGNGLVSIYDLEGSGKQDLPSVPGYDGKRTGVRALAVSPAGDWVAAGPYDGSVRLWKLPEGKLLPAGLPGGVLNVAFSPDGRLLATAQDDRKVKVYELTPTEEAFGPEPKFVLEGHEERVTDVAFNPVDPDWLATSSEDNTVRIWRLDACPAGETCSQSVILPNPSSVWAVAFSPDGRLLASGGFDRVIRVWDWERARPISELRGHEAQIRSLAFDASGRFLVSGSGDQTVRLWSVEPRYIATRLELPKEITGAAGRDFEVRSVAIAGADGPVAVAYRGGLIGLWRLDEKKWRYQLLPAPEPSVIGDIAFLPGDASQIFAVLKGSLNAAAGTLWRWQSGLNGIWTASRVRNDVATFALRPPEGRQLAVATQLAPEPGVQPLQRLALLASDTGEELLAVPIPPTKFIYQIAFSGDGSRLAVSFLAFDEKSVAVAVFGLNGTSKEIFRTSYSGYDSGKTIALSEDGGLLAVGCSVSDDGCKARAVKKDDEPRQSEKVLAERWGTDIWSIDEDQAVPRATATGHISKLTRIVFSPDGTQLVTAALDDLVKVWTVDSGNELASLGGHTQNLWALAMSPDGKTLVSGSGDETVLMRRFYPGLDALAEAAEDYLPKAEPQVTDCPSSEAD